MILYCILMFWVLTGFVLGLSWVCVFFLVCTGFCGGFAGVRVRVIYEEGPQGPSVRIKDEVRASVST